jgi:hypothetical protein
MLAVLAEDGRGAAKNPARVKQLRTRADSLDGAPKKAASTTSPAADEEACRKDKSADRCLAAGSALQETDAVKAEELFRIGCAANKQTCGLWSFAIDRFRRDDASRGTRVLEQGCQEGSSMACLVLAEVLHLGYRGGARAEARAADVYQKACDTGEAFACRVTASRFRAVKNAAKADELRDKAQKLEEEADRTRRDWAHDGAEQRAQGPHAQELARALAEWRALTEKARARSQARTKRLESAYAGHRLLTVPPFTKEDGDASAAREASVRRLVTSLFTAPTK